LGCSPINAVRELGSERRFGLARSEPSGYGFWLRNAAAAVLRLDLGFAEVRRQLRSLLFQLLTNFKGSILKNLKNQMTLILNYRFWITRFI
jgi:hypothetical protein